jgi:hypothetical protein
MSREKKLKILHPIYIMWHIYAMSIYQVMKGIFVEFSFHEMHPYYFTSLIMVLPSVKKTNIWDRNLGYKSGLGN